MSCSQIIYPITHLPPVIDLGKQTEKGVTRIGFDVHEWMDNWPDMVFSVQPTRPGESASYNGATELVGSVLFWLVGAVDTEIPGGGTVEVLGVSDNERKLSATCRTTINATMTDTTAEVPEPNQPWVDQVILAGEGAKADAQAAETSAQAAAASETAAGQYSANAGAQAQAAATSATDAAASAQAAEQAKQSAVDQADDAEQSAKDSAASAQDAEQSAQAAETSASNAETAADAAQGSATSANGSATAAAESAADAATSATNADASAKAAAASAAEISGKIMVVTGTLDTTIARVVSSHTVDEIRAAVLADKCIFYSTGNQTYPYIGETDGLPTFELIYWPTEGTETKEFGLWRSGVRIGEDGYVLFYDTKPAKTPNSFALTFSGAVNATYNGSEPVTVEIPAGGSGAGLPETADPLMHLVTDADGNVGWEERLAYKQTAQVENLASTELPFVSDDDGYALTTPWAADVVAGAVCTVNYNGTDYVCTAVEYTAVASGFPEGAICVLGNLSAMGFEGIEGDNAEAPFLMLAVSNAYAAELGAYAMFIPLDGATSVTIAVSSVVTTYKTIDKEYIPGDLLPSVTTDNEGQFLRVVSGKWAAAAIANAEEASF